PASPGSARPRLRSRAKSIARPAHRDSRVPDTLVRVTGAAAAIDEIPGIRRRAVERFFAERVPGGEGDLRFTLISGGRSNLTYLEEGRSGRWGLRRPPLCPLLPTAPDMAREYRVQAALAATGVPVPRPLDLREDASLDDAT